VILTAATDILFTTEPDPRTLRKAAARAFEVDPSNVAVGPLLELNPTSDTRVILHRQPEDARGDFPVWYGLTVEEPLVERVDRALDVITRSLGLVAISDADDDESMTIHLPDGTGHIVRLEPDADEAFRLTPGIRQLIERAATASRQARGSGRAVAN
jgi:hypothetical protein